MEKPPTYTDYSLNTMFHYHNDTFLIPIPYPYPHLPLLLILCIHVHTIPFQIPYLYPHPHLSPSHTISPYPSDTIFWSYKDYLSNLKIFQATKKLHSPSRKSFLYIGLVLAILRRFWVVIGPVARMPNLFYI